MTEQRLTEQQLARHLIQAGLVTPQQVRFAAERRTSGVGIAQALVDSGAVTANQILSVAPDAFTIGSQNAASQNAASHAAPGNHQATGEDRVLVVIATGGLAATIAPLVPAIEHLEPNLTLDGLRILWRRAQTA